jgi:hypothetical protein
MECGRKTLRREAIAGLAGAPAAESAKSAVSIAGPRAGCGWRRAGVGLVDRSSRGGVAEGSDDHTTSKGVRSGVSSVKVNVSPSNEHRAVIVSRPVSRLDLVAKHGEGALDPTSPLGGSRMISSSESTTSVTTPTVGSVVVSPSRLWSRSSRALSEDGVLGGRQRCDQHPGVRCPDRDVAAFDRSRSVDVRFLPSNVQRAVIVPRAVGELDAITNSS